MGCADRARPRRRRASSRRRIARRSRWARPRRSAPHVLRSRRQSRRARRALCAAQHMSAFPMRRPMRGHAARARTLTLGRTALGRAMGTLLAIIMLGMTLGFALTQTGPAASAGLLCLSSVIAGWYSSQVTGAAAKAQRVMANSIAPTLAMRAWRHGWLQAEVILWLVFAGICLLVIVWHDGLGDGAWAVPGAVLTAQVLGALAALASQGRVPQAWYAAPWIWAAACVIYVRSEWNG